LGSTWDALKHAEQERELAKVEGARAIAQLGEDVAGLHVSVHALEDRVGLEIGALSDELRQAIAKAQELNASRDRATEERLQVQLGWLAAASQRGERRINALIAVTAFAALIWLLRC
jgi:hypothetical protein